MRWTLTEVWMASPTHRKRSATTIPWPPNRSTEKGVVLVLPAEAAAKFEEVTRLTLAEIDRAAAEIRAEVWPADPKPFVSVDGRPAFLMPPG